MISKEKQDQFDQLVALVRASPASSFYRELWGGGPPGILTHSTFKAAKLEKRLYRNPKGLTRVIRSEGCSFLVLRGLDDIHDEVLGVSGNRPLVMFSDSSQTIEKSFWCYEHNLVPIPGEHYTPESALRAIEELSADSLLSDIVMAEAIAQASPGGFLSLLPLTIIDSRFDRLELLPIHYKSVSALLSLPETGSFAFICPEAFAAGSTLFHAKENAIIEIATDGRLLITNLSILPTPIIRYETGLLGKSVKSGCACREAEESFMLS